MKFATLGRWPLLRGGITIAVFVVWLVFKERVIKAIQAAASDVWSSRIFLRRVWWILSG